MGTSSAPTTLRCRRPTRTEIRAVLQSRSCPWPTHRTSTPTIRSLRSCDRFASPYPALTRRCRTVDRHSSPRRCSPSMAVQPTARTRPNLTSRWCSKSRRTSGQRSSNTRGRTTPCTGDRRVGLGMTLVDHPTGTKSASSSKTHSGSPQTKLKSKPSTS